jgi:predicted permease
MLNDLRLAIRLLVKDRSFAITALLTLAVATGANTAIFSIVRSVLLKPLPVPDSNRIVLIYNSYPNAGAPKAEAAVPDYFDRLAGADAFEEQALYRRQGLTLGAAGSAERLTAVRATPSFFRLVQASPSVGRIFTEQEGEEGKDRSVLLSHAFWQRQFGGKTDVLGRELRMNGVQYLVVGVLPADFKFLWNDIDVWVPAAFTVKEKSDDSRHSNNWQMIGRLKRGATIAQAQQQIDAINARNDERFPQFRKLLKDVGFASFVVGLQDEVVREVRPVLYLLWGGVLFVLLIGCVNIANLVVVRSTARSREMATRHAIGANLGRLSRQVITETTLLSVTGGVLGVLLGWWGLRAIGSLELDDLPRGHEIALDWVSAAVVLGTAIGVGLIIGVVPAARLFRMNLNSALREEGRGGTSGRGTNLLRRGLATAQVAIAMVLLVGAGLMLASFSAVLRLDPGFRPEGVVTASITLPQAKYAEDPSIVSFTSRALDALRALPGVERAAFTSSLPFTGDRSSSVILAEGYVMKEGESLISPLQTTVSEGYFEAMGIPVVRGRSFDRRDTPESPKTIIVDERLAAKFWPGQDPIGRRMYQPENPSDLLKIGPDTKFLTVVGVVRNVQITDPGAPFSPVGAYYYPITQQPERGLFAVLQARGDTESVTADLRRAITQVDPEMPVYGVRTMLARMDQGLIGRRLPMLVAIAFGVVALLLSAIGIYGVLAYGVSQRRREIGIRLALGSSAREVFSLVFSEGAKIVSVGLLLGVAGAYGVGQAMTSQLFEVRPHDPWVIGGVVVLLSAVALIATFVPARRAARVSPVEVLG